MKKITYLLITGLSLIFSFNCLAIEEESLTLMKQQPKANEFKLPDMDGDLYSLSQYKGQVVVINFWATWCPPCREELPSMNRAWEKLKDHNIQMIAINVGEDEDTIFSFMGDYPIDFQVLLDESGKTIKDWPVKGLPTTFVVDTQGRLFYRAIGGREWDSDPIIEQVKSLAISP